MTSFETKRNLFLTACFVSLDEEGRTKAPKDGLARGPSVWHEYVQVIQEKGFYSFFAHLLISTCLFSKGEIYLVNLKCSISVIKKDVILYCEGTLNSLVLFHLFMWYFLSDCFA